MTTNAQYIGLAKDLAEKRDEYEAAVARLALAERSLPNASSNRFSDEALGFAFSDKEFDQYLVEVARTDGETVEFSVEATSIGNAVDVATREISDDQVVSVSAKQRPIHP